MEGVGDDVGGIADEAEVVARGQGPGDRADAVFDQAQVGPASLGHFDGIDGQAGPLRYGPGGPDDGFIVPDIVEKDVFSPDPPGRRDPGVLLLFVEEGGVEGQVDLSVLPDQAMEDVDAVLLSAGEVVVVQDPVPVGLRFRAGPQGAGVEADGVGRLSAGCGEGKEVDRVGVAGAGVPDLVAPRDDGVVGPEADGLLVGGAVGPFADAEMVPAEAGKALFLPAQDPHDGDPVEVLDQKARGAGPQKDIVELPVAGGLIVDDLRFDPPEGQHVLQGPGLQDRAVIDGFMEGQDSDH